MFGAGICGNNLCRSKRLSNPTKAKCRVGSSTHTRMKGRTGRTGAATAQAQVAQELKRGERGVRQRSFDSPRPVSQRHHQPTRVLVAVAAVAIAILAGALLVSYSSKLYQNWHENGLLDRATALLEQ